MCIRDRFSDFIFPAFDQIVNELAKFRYRSGGEYPVPMVIRTPYGGGIRGGHYHSQSPEAYFAHTPGLKVVIPSNPYDAKGLLLSAMREEDPILFMEPKRVYRASRGEVPEGEYTIPIGQAKIVRPGKGVTVLCYGSMVHSVVEAVEKQGSDVYKRQLQGTVAAHRSHHPTAGSVAAGPPWDDTASSCLLYTSRCV